MVSRSERELRPHDRPDQPDGDGGAGRQRKPSTDSGGGLLLDLHNLYCNAVNYGFSGHRFLDELDLANVIEVHIANGSELGGMYADSHSGAPPEPVWDLLDDLVGRAPNLRGITFEFHDSYLPLIGFDGIADVIARARRAWETRI